MLNVCHFPHAATEEYRDLTPRSLQDEMSGGLPGQPIMRRASSSGGMDGAHDKTASHVKALQLRLEQQRRQNNILMSRLVAQETLGTSYCRKSCL